MHWQTGSLRLRISKEELKMVKLYVKKIKAGKMTIDEVPERWREEVRKALENK